MKTIYITIRFVFLSSLTLFAVACSKTDEPNQPAGENSEIVSKSQVSESTVDESQIKKADHDVNPLFLERSNQRGKVFRKFRENGELVYELVEKLEPSSEWWRFVEMASQECGDVSPSELKNATVNVEGELIEVIISWPLYIPEEGDPIKVHPTCYCTINLETEEILRYKILSL